MSLMNHIGHSVSVERVQGKVVVLCWDCKEHIAEERFSEQNAEEQGRFGPGGRGPSPAKGGDFAKIRPARSGGIRKHSRDIRGSD